jgi:hypothetical protein
MTGTPPFPGVMAHGAGTIKPVSIVLWTSQERQSIAKRHSCVVAAQRCWKKRCMPQSRELKNIAAAAVNSG